MLDHLEDNIRRVIADIRPQMLEKVIENWTSRLDYIRASLGSPMPEIIFKIGSSSHTIKLPPTMPSKRYLQNSSVRSSVADPQPCNRIVFRHARYNLVALHFKYDQARRRFVEWAQNEIAVAPDFHKRILFSDEAHFWLNGYVNKQNCRIWSEANP
ncbi:hypothetical protein TNCV_4743871 [Trichonephila clavipes]|nr:hypothetical protein TNCV_4743871 [Trichonephila clavipes]